MRSYNLLIKILLVLLVLILFWQTSNLWKPATPEKSELEKLIEKQQFQQVLVTVYYEALCPDSRSFIKHQLKPTFNRIEDYIEVVLIPYGKAETIVTEDDYEFKCQHGETECEANIIHACSINKVQNPRKRLELVECMISNNIHPQAILETCAQGMDEMKEIVECSKSMEGRKLLKRYGDLTKNLHPKVSFIPTITLDNKMDNQILILKNLLRQVCQLLDSPPNMCIRDESLGIRKSSSRASCDRWPIDELRINNSCEESTHKLTGNTTLRDVLGSKPHTYSHCPRRFFTARKRVKSISQRGV